MKNVMGLNGRMAVTILVSIVMMIAVASATCVGAGDEAVIFRVGLSTDPHSLGPSGTDSAMCVAFRIHSSLFTADENWEPTPDLAVSWDISDDYLTYTFHLNPVAKFHDGTPVTSEDVKFSILEVDKTLVSLTNRGLIPAIESIETPDEHTVVFNLNYPYPEMLDPYYGAGSRASIVSKARWEGTDYFTNPNNLEPIGSGPYKFVEWVKGSHIVLERWEGYWGEKPAVEKIVYRIINDPTAMSLAFENGELDWVPYQILASDVVQLNSLPGKDAAFHGGPCGDSISLRFNLRKEMFQDITVRRAFAYAINRDRIPDLVYFGGAVPATGQVQDSAFTHWWCNPDVHQVPYDPEIAKVLLDSAGYPVGSDGWRFHTTIRHMTLSPETIYVAELVKADLADVGIDAEIITLDYAAWIDQTFVTWGFDLNLSSFCSGPAPPSLGRFTTDSIQPVGWSNDMGFSNAEYDTLHKIMLTETDLEKRKAVLFRMQEILVEEQPMVHLVHRQSPSAWNSAKFVGETVWRSGMGQTYMRLTTVKPTR